MVTIFNVTNLKSIKKSAPKALMAAKPDHQFLTRNPTMDVQVPDHVNKSEFKTPQ